MRRLLTSLVVMTVVLAVAGLAPLQFLSVRAQDAALPGVGDPVTFPVDESGGTATVTVTQVVDPFGSFGAGAAPEGERFVYVAIDVANGSDEPLDLDPATIFVVDTEGFVHRPGEAFNTGEAGGTQTIAPGEEVAGGVVVSVPEETTLAAVYHDPAEDRLILLALLTGSAPSGEDGDGDGDGDGGPAATEEPDTGIDDDGDDEEDGDDGDGEDGDGEGGDETPVAIEDVDCAAFETYYAETNDRIAQLEAVAAGMEDLVNLLTTDPTGAGATVQEWADALIALAEEQENAEVPAGLEALNDQTVEMFNTYADAFEQLARGLANFDVAAVQAIVPILQEGDALATEVIDQLEALAAQCGIEG
jgi:hypothetical protein